MTARFSFHSFRYWVATRRQYDQRVPGFQRPRPGASDQVLYPAGTYTHLPFPVRIASSSQSPLTIPKDTSIQQRLISEIFTLVSNRPSGSCNFLPLPPLLAAAGTSHSSSSATEQHNDAPSLVTYRHYATLFFIIISTSTESPLALIDLIQVYVEALDKLFENVCELDLIFNYESLHATLAEMIVGGVVIETNLDRIVAGVKAQGTVAKRPVNEGRGAGLGAGLGMGVWAGR